MKTSYFKERVYVPVKNADDRVFDIEAEFDWYTEKNYGADADGNRGMPMSFVEDIRINTITEVDSDGNTTEVDYSTLDKDIQEYIETIIGESETD